MEPVRPGLRQVWEGPPRLAGKVGAEAGKNGSVWGL